jgi:hypothetical protein
VDPSWTVHTSEGQAVRLAHVDGACAALATTASEQQVFHGDAAGLGWWAPVYGKLLPAPTLRFETRQTAPFSIFTVIASGNVPVPIAVEPVVVLADRGHEWHCAGISVKYGEADLLALFATPLAPNPDGPRKRVLCADGELMTDARVAVLRRQGAEPTSLDLIEGTCGVWTTERSFGAGPNPAPPDRHLDLAPVAGSLVSS